jgi:hypothetical protein
VRTLDEVVVDLARAEAERRAADAAHMAAQSRLFSAQTAFDTVARELRAIVTQRVDGLNGRDPKRGWTGQPLKF